ncbi:glycine cleavage system protein GcvH [Halovulum dunhuangense]|uniref:Glycine cleavage system H protein n=1 Tax=Halovulum dunhuangense TaxID=1505036 RepID=A0A849L3Q4_9RHOB|nr:glycine cleavage system protein GcvH [Halovulum dunhuangense]NNU80955.1 glycine cleavage system protein GcvH [Halovulum dunhuangense]
MAIYYTEEHEWLDVDGDIATVGITEHAAEQLGEVVYVELKEVGESFDKGDEMGVVESVKAASEIYAPVTGEIIEVNDSLSDAPAQVNDSPESDAWFYKIRISDEAELEELMDEAAYKLLIS